MITLNVNGVNHTVDVDPQTPLLWVLRDVIGLTGTKYACGIGVCGACTVHVGGVAQRSCQMAAADAVGHKILTIEGLSQDRSHPLQRAWIAHQTPQCGYCQPGMIMAAAALLKHSPHPTDAEINDAVSNICVCGTYPRIRAAIHAAAAGGAVRAAVLPEPDQDPPPVPLRSGTGDMVAGVSSNGHRTDVVLETEG